MKQYIATTCVECGAKGQMQTDNAAIIHKTILCADCTANTRSIELDAASLLRLSQGAVFCEHDYPATPIFVKLRNAGEDDVLVRPLQDDEPMRLGLREMDACDRNSKRWALLNVADLRQTLDTAEAGALVEATM